MPLEIRHVSASDTADICAVTMDASLREHFDTLQSEERVRNELSDPQVARPLTHLAVLDGRPVGFIAGYAVRPSKSPGWVFLRLGVSESARRRGIAHALLCRAARMARERDILGAGAELLLPMEDFSQEGRAFAMRFAFQPERHFWRMSRPAGPMAAPEWPDGVTIRVLDGSDSALTDWSTAYEDSFAGHYRPIPSTPDLCREIAAAPGFLADGLVLAYRDGRCVGFCRNETLGDVGIIGLLGVVHGDRGTGLGRALLRWGVRYFDGPRWESVGLGVDGANDTATSLYRSEGFEIIKRRTIWRGSLDAVLDGTAPPVQG